MGNQRFLKRLTRRADADGPLAEPAHDDGSALESLILPDVGPQGTTGGMSKRAFLQLLESEVTRAAEQELRGTGRTTDGCPWIAYWFRYYERRDATHLARAIEKYAPEASTAERPEDVVALVRERVRDGVRRSLRSGTIEDLPPGIPLEAFAPGSEASVPVGEPPTDPFGLTPEPARGDAPSVATTAPAPADSARAELELGAGEPLDARTRSRMESAFRTDLSDVRLHADAAGQTAAGRRNAQAFAYGSDIAMAPGRHAPGTPTGDALLAHELAHVIQQRPVQQGVETATEATTEAATTWSSIVSSPQTAPASRRASAPRHAVSGTSAPALLEADADRSATGAMRSLWGATAREPDASLDARPSRRSTLQVAGCGGTPDDPRVHKTVQVKPIVFFGSTGTPAADVTYANTTVFHQANLSLNKQPDLPLKQEDTQTLLGLDRTLDTRTGWSAEEMSLLGSDSVIPTADTRSRTAEEAGLVSALGSDTVIPILYVKEIEPDSCGGNPLGEHIPQTCGNRTVVVVENGIHSRTVSHEVGHALGLDHEDDDKDNLMARYFAIGNTRLNREQIATIRSSRFAQ